MAGEHSGPTGIDDAQGVFYAEYSPPESETWLDNPLIEALPAVLSDDQFARAVCYFPPHDAGMSEHSKHLRLIYIQRVLQFFIPMEQHLLLQQRFARIIRDGYTDRNPLADPGWSRLPGQLDDLSEVLKYGIAPYEPPSALGFSIIGIGGVGKTVGVNTILRTYPRVLVHRSYTDSSGTTHQLMRTQIVFLKLDCPEDGTLKSLCLSFFQKVDQLTGFTSYYKKYGFRGTKSRTATEMLPDMARVSALHSIGVLIIDEIQFLSKQKSGGHELMLHWFTHLVNEIKLPVVLIGTPRAEEILNKAFWQMRRNAGQGEFVWGRMQQNGEWERFLRSLWRYQYVRNPTNLVNGKQVPQNLSDVLYQESQGIADFAVKMFMIAQERAINSGLECLTPELIETVAKDSFGNARKIIKGIKDNNPQALANVDDVRLDLERIREKNSSVPERTASAALASTSDPVAAKPLESPEGCVGTLSPVLSTLVSNSLACGETGARAVRAAGYICSPLEFGA